MTWLNAPVFVAFLLYLMTVGHRRGYLTLDALFLYFQLIMVVGTFSGLDTDVPADVTYGYILAYCFISYAIACVFIFAVSPKAKDQASLISGSSRVVITRMSGWLWAMVILCLLIVLLYFRAVGYSALLSGLSSQLSGADADIATLRLNSYSGAQYFAPGYVNQFKNALLPALVVVSVTYFSVTRTRHIILAVILVLLTVFGLLGTGQRGAFVLSLVFVIVYLNLLDRKRFRRRMAGVVLFGLTVSAVATFALGRSAANVASESGVFGKIGVTVSELWSRITESNQASGIAGFRYTYGLPTQYGREWGQSLLSLLPGPATKSGPSLDNLIFASVYGTTRGTNPPSIWGSIYYNFGIIGITALPICFAILFRAVSDRALTRSTYTTLELAGIAGTFATVGSWVADGPNYMANVGTAMFLIIWAVGRKQSRREQGYLQDSAESNGRRRGDSPKDYDHSYHSEFVNPSAPFAYSRQPRDS